MPPTRRLGKDAKIWIEREVKGVATRIEATAALRGFDGLGQFGNVQDRVEIGGGGGVRGSARSGYQEGSGSFTIDANVDVDAVMFACAGQQMTIDVAPTGAVTSGSPRRQLTGQVTRYSHSCPDRGKQRYSVTIEGEAPVDYTPYA